MVATVLIICAMTGWSIVLCYLLCHHIRENKKPKTRCQTCHIPLKYKYAITCDPVCHAKYIEHYIRFELDIKEVEPSGYLFIKDKKEIK